MATDTIAAPADAMFSPGHHAPVQARLSAGRPVRKLGALT